MTKTLIRHTPMKHVDLIKDKFEKKVADTRMDDFYIEAEQDSHVYEWLKQILIQNLSVKCRVLITKYGDRNWVDIIETTIYSNSHVLKIIQDKIKFILCKEHQFTSPQILVNVMMVLITLLRDLPYKKGEDNIMCSVSLARHGKKPYIMTIKEFCVTMLSVAKEIYKWK